MSCIPVADRNPGDYPLEVLPNGWANAKVSFKNRERYEIVHLKSNTRYLQEPMKLVAFKCFELFLVGLPLYFLCYAAFHLVRLPVVTLLNGSPKAFLKQIWTLVRIPFYWISLMFAALYGAFNPLEGRALFGALENSLHGKDRRSSVTYKSEFECLNQTWASLSTVEDEQTFYIGICMQPYGKTNDSYLTKVEVLQNSRAV